MWRDVKSCISIYLATHLIIYVSIYLSNYRASYRLFFIPWYKFAIPCLHLDWRLKIEDSTETPSSNLQSSGGTDDPKKKSCGIFILKGKRLPSVYPFHSIPSVRPSIHPIHLPILSIHPSILSVHLHIYLPSYLFTYLSTYLSTNLSSYLSFDPSIYLIILSYNVAILGLHVDWRFKKEQSSVQRRVQRVPTTRSIEKPPNRL